MHELSIAMSILDIVKSTCEEQGCTCVQRVRVKVGRASGVMAEALLFSFDVAKAGTVAAVASLDIEEVPVGGHCRDCVADFTVEEKYVLQCPRCGGASFAVHSGHELEILELEVDE